MQNVALIEITVTEHNFLTDFSSNLSFLYFALLRGLNALHLWSDACILFFFINRSFSYVYFKAISNLPILHMKQCGIASLMIIRKTFLISVIVARFIFCYLNNRCFSPRFYQRCTVWIIKRTISAAMFDFWVIKSGS